MKKFISALIMLASLDVVAGSRVEQGKIFEVLSGPEQGERVMIKVNSAPSSLPTCSASYGSTWNYVFDGSSEVGKRTLNMVLTAYASGKNVKLIGTGSCGIDGKPYDVEQLGSIILK